MSAASDDAEILRCIGMIGVTCRYRLNYQTGLKAKDVTASVDRLLAQGKIIELGTAKELGISNVRGNVVMIGLPGAKKVERKTKGSGQIAGRITIPQYRYGSTRLG